MFGSYGMRGFGDADVTYTRSDGVTKTGHVTTAVNCNDPFAVQKMLIDLGYPISTISGTFGPQTFGALAQFAKDHGVAYQSNTYPKGSICAALADAWNAKQAAKAAPAPAKTLPVVVLDPNIMRGAFVALQQPKSARQAEVKADGSSTAATTTPPPDEKKEGVAGWWSGLSTPAKVAIGVGGLALLGSVVYFAVVKKPAPRAAVAPGYQANKRSSRKYIHASKLPDTCRTHRPKGYPTSKALYGLPECWMYPLDNKKNVRAAASRFGKHKRRYSKAVQAKVAKRIDAAKRRFRIGEYR